MSPAWIVSPSCRPVALTRPITSPGYASSIVSRSAPNAVVAYLVVSSRPLRSHVTVMPRSKRPEQMRAKARRSRCDGSMFAWTLNTNAEKGPSSGRGRAVVVDPRRRRRGEVDDGVEDHAHPEVGQRRADEHRRRVAGEERRQVDVGADGVEQADLVGRRLPGGALLGRGDVGAARSPPGRATPRGRCACSGCSSPVRRSITPRRSPAMPTGHVAGRRAQPDLVLDLVEQLERFAARAGRTC